MKEYTTKDITDGGAIVCCQDFREDLIDAPLWFHKKGLQETASGYGSKLTTRFKIRFEKKDYRVYCTLFSNSGSSWFKVKGKKIFVN